MSPMADVLEVLYDLDETSKRKVSVLDHFKVSMTSARLLKVTTSNLMEALLEKNISYQCYQ